MRKSKESLINYHKDHKAVTAGRRVLFLTLDKLLTKLRKASAEQRLEKVLQQLSYRRVLILGPNDCAFLLDQHLRAIGPAVVYERDFEGQRGGGDSVGMFLGL